MAFSEKDFCTRLSVLDTRVQLIDDYLCKFPDEFPPLCEIKSRLISYTNINATYDKCWEDLSVSGITIDETVDLKNQIANLESKLQKVHADLIYLKDKYDFEDAIETEKLKRNTSDTFSHCHADSNIPKIPPITITPFNGDPTRWLSFRESCQVVFHDNPKIEKIHKFAYLRKLLTGDALSKIEGIHISSVGYDKVWETLCSFYDGNRIVIDCHLDALFNAKKIEKDSYDEINKLLNICITNISSLEAHGYVVDGLAELFLVHLITKKLSVNLKKEWEKTLEGKEVPTYNLLKDFLMKFCRVLKSGEMNGSHPKPNPKFNRNDLSNRNIANNRSSFAVADENSSSNSGKSNSCVFCNAEFHPFVYCSKFLNMSVSERFSKIKSLQLCLNCFGSKHMSSTCTKMGCKKCKSKHHTLLHFDQPPPVSNSNASSNVSPSVSNFVSNPTIQSTQNSVPSSSIPNTEKNSAFCVQSAIRKPVLLSTAIIHIKDKNDRYHECRALIDQGSQSNFMSHEFANRFPFDFFQVSNMEVNSLNQNKAVITKAVRANVKSCTTDFNRNLHFLIVSSISDALPQQSFDISRWVIPKNISLADPYFNTSRAIDVILGAEIFYEILASGKLQCHPNQSIFQETLLGWLVGGQFQLYPKNNNSFFVNSTDTTSETDSLNENVQRFWELESIPHKKHLSKEEEMCENRFIQTHTRDTTGRYVVKLPLKDSVKDLGESKDQAMRRFLNLEKRFDQNDQLKSDYIDFIDDYLNRGHMKLLNHNEETDSDLSYYLPHHAVFKPTSSTTKTRVVFDASAKTSSKLSLNNVMMTGPTVQQTLFNIVLRFRKYQYVLTSDISKMYRQVVVDPTDTPLQRILWRSSSTQPIRTYELTTVTYGTAAAPYLATRVLNQLAEDEKSKFPKASEIIKSDFYVDDVLTGANTLDEARNLQSDLIELLSLGGFKLHKWASNTEELLEKIPPEDREILRSDDASEKEYIGTLGLYWKPITDDFIFNIKIPEHRNEVTKRTALSDAAKLFDPLGLASPVTILAKLFIQDIWKVKCDWDEPLPTEMVTTWQNYLSQLPNLNTVSFPRCVVSPNSIRHELHGFADASQKAYGCCVYIKTTDHNNVSEMHLLCSKSRVAPLKSISIPRLELCAALLLSELVIVVMESLKIDFDQVMLWSDSTITLHWIHIEPNKVKTFVANRVSQINELTSNYSWNHIATSDNPADLVSRGLMPTELIDCKFWWNGPECIRDSIVSPKYEHRLSSFTEEELELKKETLSFVVSKSEPFKINFERFSSFIRLIRTFAYIFRWKNHSSKKSDPLTVQELDYACIKLIVHVQKSEYNTEYDCLLKGKEIDAKSKLKCLTPFLDTTTGLLRVGGRLQNTDFEYDVKHQIILPKIHRLTDLIFKHYHLKHMHASTQLLVSFIRQRYWPISAKGIAKRIIRECITCFRHKPILSNQLMGSLPSDRVTPEKPFYKTGVDLCGPIIVKNKIPRNSQPFKAYIVCFVCLVTKALHLEIVSELTAECFIASLKRFNARRGPINTIWSDNATNFVGANKILKKEFELFRSAQSQNKISDYCVAESINWKFIPPRAPNFGGLWESSIKSLKFHLKRVTTGCMLSFEELNTLMIQIEGILNSRPLTMYSNDPLDPEPLTPSHFLTGGPITAIPEPTYDEVPSNRLSSWRKISKMVQSFWSRFSAEYIHTLQERKKWRNVIPNIKLNDIVLIVEDNTPPNNWMLGLVIKFVPGSDGIIRVVELKTKHGVFKRSITKIAKLPILSDTAVNENEA